MELAAVHVAALHGSGKRRAVFSGGGHISVAVRRVVGMHKVYAIAFLYAAKQRAIGLHKMQGIPADMRYFESGRDHIGNGPHTARDKPQPRVLAILIAFIKQQLHAQADAKKRRSLLCRLAQRLIQSKAAQLPRSVLKGADARQDDFFGHQYLAGIARHPGRFSCEAKGALQ